MRCLFLGLAALLLNIDSFAQDKIVVAMTPLDSQGYGEYRDSITKIMQAELSQSSMLQLVDRDQLNKALSEMKLAQQSMLTSDKAAKLGKIVGAKYFLSGEVTKMDEKPTAIVKVIELETTLMKMAYSVVGSDGSIAAGKALSVQVETLIKQFEADKVADDKKQVAELPAKSIPADWKKPTVMVIIPEMHIRQPQLIDPAGETEVAKRLIAAGFKVINSEYVHMMKTDQEKAKKMFSSLKTSSEYASQNGADVLLYGEAISEMAAGLGDFEGCRGRIELKAIKAKTEEILVSDSATGGATDLAETIAGKQAIQQAANKLCDTFLYSLAEKYNKK